MSFAQVLSILRARWWIVALVMGLTIGTTVIVSLLLPKQYSAMASVVVDVRPDPVSAIAYPTLPAGLMATQLDILQSDRVALRVVRNLKLASNPQIRRQWQEEADGQGDIETWLAESLQSHMDATPSRESNVIAVSYKAPDPRFAAALANAFVQAYIETALELRVDPAKQYSSFFDTRSRAARDALEKAQTQLSAFQREKGIIASDERLDVENARLNELSSQLVVLQALSAESTSRQSQASGASAEKLQEVLNSPVIGSLKSDLSRQQARLQELSSRLGDANPQVVELKANISELQHRIDAETRRITGGVGVTNTINRSREAQIRAELETQRAKVLKMKQVRDEGAVLEREVESAQRAYDAVLARLQQSSLESQTTQSNVNVLTQATAPVKPSSPKLLLNTLLSIFLGGLLAVGTALLLELSDRRVRAIDDVTGSLGLPVIGIMPSLDAKRRIRGNRPALQQQRVVGQLTVQGKGA